MMRPPALRCGIAACEASTTARTLTFSSASMSARLISATAPYKDDAGIVDEDVETAERCRGLVDRALDRRRIGAVGLDGDAVPALAPR